MGAPTRRRRVKYKQTTVETRERRRAVRRVHAPQACLKKNKQKTQESEDMVPGAFSSMAAEQVNAGHRSTLVNEVAFYIQ